MSVIKTHNLSKKYGDFLALDGISIEVEKGDIYGIVGHNGSGKTTLFKILSGLIFPSSGVFKIIDTWCNEEKIHKNRKNIGIAIEEPALIYSFSCYKNLMHMAILANISNKKEIVHELLEKFNLLKDKNKKVKHLSMGMKQKLSMAIALIKNPKVLILDEPMNGLDPIAIIEMRKLLLELSKEKEITILISSHILSELENMVNKVAFINKGKLLAIKNVAELKHEKLEEVYVGLMEKEEKYETINKSTII